MKSALPIVYHPNYSILWTAVHRFPMTKFQMLYQYLLENNIAQKNQFREPKPVSLETLYRVHQPDYVKGFMEGTWDRKIQKRIGFPWYPDLVKRSFAEVGGTIATVKLAKKWGLACNTAGGTHHAFPDYGSGFCILNDLAVAAHHALAKGLAGKILILDLDVHQGDGTAFIFASEPRVFTLSLHGARNFPLRKQKSDWDIPLPDGTDDGDYLIYLEDALETVLEGFAPDLVLYDAGVDVHHEDQLGKLALTCKGLFQRDHLVIRSCLQRAIPVACVVGGGYAQIREDLLPRHGTLFRAATELFARFSL